MEYRQEEPKGWEVNRRRSFYFCEDCVIYNSWSQHICWPGVKIHKKHEMKDFQDGLLECRRHCLYFVLFWVFASVLDEESLDSKVLVQIKIEKYSL